MCAALDQHAAAIRDILELGIENSAVVPVPVLLAGYARGLVEHSGRAVLRAPHDTAGWVRAEWIQLRLAGVCSNMSRRSRLEDRYSSERGSRRKGTRGDRARPPTISPRGARCRPGAARAAAGRASNRPHRR
ncbi:DUF6401 family natural product biosynthesis protein [Nocardia sp. GP40]|uniref:DUF6401 family natural product biosynthesis protein n=1 Tax=Nocardia sp. GP40 TaxID=3156268 RepID=UPI003D1E7926